jgi:hypothetical protein
LQKDRIAGQKLEQRILCEKFGSMSFEATGFVGLVAANGILSKVDFDVVNENVQHVQGFSVGVAGLAGGLAVDGTDEEIVLIGEKSVKKFGEGGLKFFDGKGGKCSTEGGLSGCWSVESEGNLESFPMSFCPSSNDGDFGQSGEGSEKDNGEESGEGVPDSAFFTGIGEFLKDGRKRGEVARRHDFPP